VQSYKLFLTKKVFNKIFNKKISQETVFVKDLIFKNVFRNKTTQKALKYYKLLLSDFISVFLLFSSNFRRLQP